MAREVFKIVDLVVTFQEEPGLDVYLIFELQDAKVKTSVRLHGSAETPQPQRGDPPACWSPHAACMHAWLAAVSISADTLYSGASRYSETRVPRPACASPTI